MPTFKYQAVTADGKATKGTLDAENLDDAGAMLRAQGLFPGGPVALQRHFACPGGFSEAPSHHPAVNGA